MKAKNLSEWHEIVLRRDNYTCVNCGAKNNLVVDHIEPRKSHPELTLETDNGRVLCGLCHTRIGKRTPPDRNRLIYINPVVQGTTLYSRLYWPKKLRPDGYGGRVDAREGAFCIIIPKPGASDKDLAGDLMLISKHFKLKADITQGDQPKIKRRGKNHDIVATLLEEDQ